MEVLQDISRAHVESFNFICRQGLTSMVQLISPLEIALPNGDRLEVRIIRCCIENPSTKLNKLKKAPFPAECRGRGLTYKMPCVLEVCWSLNNVAQQYLEKTVGEIPVMVKSELCQLYGMPRKELIEHGEEENEIGGYFIINGLEKAIRLLTVQRRNYPIAMERRDWKKIGALFTEYGVSIRCVRSDQSASNIRLHYLSDGTVRLMFAYKKEVYFVPVMLILKALVNESDRYIYSQLTRTKEKDTFYKGCITNMLRTISSKGIIFQEHALKYLGDKFRVLFNLPNWHTDIDVAIFLIEQCICVHIETEKKAGPKGKMVPDYVTSHKEKFDVLVFMVQKLFSLIKKECALESPDNPMNYEILLSGHLYLLVLKEQLGSWLGSMKFYIDKLIQSNKSIMFNQSVMQKILSRCMNISKPMENFLKTGNYVSRFDNTLKKTSGLVMYVDRQNFWTFLAHFRAVYTHTKSAYARKLLPEMWGFICPVHTSVSSKDCGLLNHMTVSCQVTNVQPDIKSLLNTFSKYGMVPYDDPMTNCYPAILDGKVIGWIHNKMAHAFVVRMRQLKCLKEQNVPETLEICLVPKTDHASQYPGLFIFTNPARMMRPVKNLLTGVNELVGTMEQVYLHIAISNKDVIDGVTLHQELSTTNMLSILANQIPYSDFNESLCNMYECQMGKQTMGTPCHALKYRSDSKIYRIFTPQSPIVRPKMHSKYHMDTYPLGTNAVIAVISCTGYNMKDAIILNKSSVERGFKRGVIYKTQVVNLQVIAGVRGRQTTLYFGRKSDDADISKFIDEDGLPYIGTKLKHGDPICSYVDTSTGETVRIEYKSTEDAYVEDVKLLGNDTGTETNQQIAIKFRVPRNPSIGDIFANRHGHKSICSFMLPIEDMPFTEGGMIPDIILDPHSFSSHMTIGMMVETMAGKVSAYQGVHHDATPFQFSETNTAVSYFGECLKNAGYDYYGTERMYSGVDGRELEADIFVGVVYYQRL